MRRIFCPKNHARILKRNVSTKETKCHRQVFSAIQPTGEAHLGNYLGALKKWVDLQNSEKNTVIYSIADLHSITIPKKPEELNNNIITMTATLLACGIDTNKSILFQQSAVVQHQELSWILGTLTTMARLAQLPQYKDKCALVKDPPVGIFLYPVLQAADIMLYRTTHVPVGEDQVHQIQLASHLIKVFKGRFGGRFPEPDVLLDESSGRIKSLLEPSKKMSKSDPRKKSVISLTDEPEEILVKCQRAMTDFKSEVTYEPEARPGVCNLILIHSGLTGKTPEEIVEECKNLNTGEYKKLLAEVIIEHLTPIRTKIKEYMNSREYLINVLKVGANRAQEIAAKTMEEVKQRVGFDLEKAKVPSLRAKTYAQ